jgi:hypothetical protein
MGTPVESHLDDLALQTKIDDYGDMLYFLSLPFLQLCSIMADLRPTAVHSLVTIPNVEKLTPQERLLVMRRAQQLQAGSSLQADALQAALR